MLHSFEWVTIIPGLKLVPVQVAHALIVAAVLLLIAVLVNRRLAASGAGVVPAGTVSLTGVMETAYEGLLGLMEESLGHHARHFVYLIGGLGFFILFSNLLGQIPGMAPPTDNINTTAACAIIVFVATHVYGVKAHGFGYLKQFTGPFWWLAWLMIPIEIIGHLARPLSLSLRLFGNLMGDHMVYAIFVFMAVGLSKTLTGSWVTWLFLPLGMAIPAVPVFLGLFVAFVQTFVFILLSMMYISGALAEAH